MRQWIDNLLCRIFHKTIKQSIPGRGTIQFCAPCKRRVKG